jgi:hypothetical protein
MATRDTRHLDRRIRGDGVNLAVQAAVTCGVWWALLVDVLGNYEGQHHTACWAPIIRGVIGVTVAVHVVYLARLLASNAHKIVEMN